MSLGRRLAISAAAGATFAGLSWAAWSLLHPRPTVAQVIALAEAHRYAEARDRAHELLRETPDSNEAHMVMAQMLLDRPEPPTPAGRRPDPRPAREALGHLGRIRPDNDTLAALVAMYRGKAEYRLSRMDEAEASWDEALRLDPAVPEAGWCLQELYYLQARPGDARRLALRLHEVEPDPRDRVQLLLELVRQDAQPLAPGSVVAWFEPVVRQNPGDLHANLALGLALVRDSHVDRGVDLLRRALEAHPGHPDAWDAYLTGLDDAGQLEAMARGVAHLPPSLADSDRFAKHRARVAQERADWEAAVRDYRRARQADPNDDRILYRLARSLRNAGAIDEAGQLDRIHRDRLAASQELRALYDRANAEKMLGTTHRIDLYQELADQRERSGRRDEALAWHRLVLRAKPDDALSLAAIQRLAVR